MLNVINASFKTIGQTGVSLNHRGLTYAIATEITHLERSFLLEQCGELWDTRFYASKPYDLKSAKLCGPVKYSDEMPCVFRYSKLNLCPTLKCIQSGIPLRALDIMGSRGVLLSNWQPELAEYFEDGKDCIMYESMEDLRKQIAVNGYQKVKENFSYPQRIRTLFHTAGIE